MNSQEMKKRNLLAKCISIWSSGVRFRKKRDVAAKAIKAVVFDFDGTLADTSHIVLECVNKVAKSIGRKEITEEDVRRFRGKSAREVIRKELKIPLVKIPVYARRVRKLMKERMKEVRLKAWVKPLFKELSKDYIVGIVTSNTKDCVEFALKRAGIDQVKFVFSNTSIFGKHKVLRRMLKRQRLSRNEIIYIGDEVRDIDACKKTGIRIISVCWGLNTKEILLKNKPDFVIDKPEQILDVVKSISAEF